MIRGGGKSGKKKDKHKQKLLGLDIFQWGGGLPCERVGAKKFGMSFETQGNQTFGRDIPGVPERLERKKKFFASWGPILWPYLGSSARAPKRALGSCYGGVRSPYGAIGSPYKGIRSLTGLF